MDSISKIAFTAFIAVMFPIMSCNDIGDSSALAGRWQLVSSSDKEVVMDLSNDGTGIFTEDSKVHAITWKTENGRFYITTHPDEVFVFGYKVQGLLLTFTSDKGEILEYMKCHKDCQDLAKEYVKAKFGNIEKGSLTDSRDGKDYKTVKLDKQTWMAENLNYNANGSKCYDNSESNCQKYGRLYDWNAAMNVCPKDWHLPSDKEWEALVNFAGGAIAGNMLKASSGWIENGNGVDATGFSALPGEDGGTIGIWWSAAEGSYAYYIHRYADVVKYQVDKSGFHSVRCVLD